MAAIISELDSGLRMGLSWKKAGLTLESLSPKRKCGVLRTPRLTFKSADFNQLDKSALTLIG